MKLSSTLFSPSDHGDNNFPSLLPTESMSQQQSWPFQQKARKGRLRFWERVFSEINEKTLLSYCKALIHLLSPEDVNGHLSRRLSGGFGEPGYEYSYKKTTRIAQPWPSWLLYLAKQLESLFDQTFEFALINYYPDHQSGIGDHADGEKDMKKNSKIVCLSFGSTHTLRIRFAKEKQYLLQIKVTSGSMYSMEGQFQQFLLHGTEPVHDQVDHERFSITFRNLVKREETHALGRKRIADNNTKSDDGHVFPAKQKKLTHKTRQQPGPGDRPGIPQ